MQNNRILFTGREWVAGFGFYEYRARAYNPTLGRFMSEDPIGFAAGDANLFRYCGGDPVNRIDPYGLEQETVMVGLGVGIMITWGTNNGQSNFGMYVGAGVGVAYSYTPLESNTVFPGVVPGITAQATHGFGKYLSLNANSTVTTRDGTASATFGAGNGAHQYQDGIVLDNAGNISPAVPTYSYLDGSFVGIGATSYGVPRQATESSGSGEGLGSGDGATSAPLSAFNVTGRGIKPNQFATIGSNWIEYWGPVDNSAPAVSYGTTASSTAAAAAWEASWGNGSAYGVLGPATGSGSNGTAGGSSISKKNK
jgi:RHS repeat-associated protein